MMEGCERQIMLFDLYIFAIIYLIGQLGFRYHYTSDYEWDWIGALAAIVIATLGPLTWLFGSVIHDNKRNIPFSFKRLILPVYTSRHYLNTR